MKKFVKLAVVVLAANSLSACLGDTTSSLPNGNYQGTFNPSLANQIPNSVQDTVVMQGYVSGQLSTIYIQGGTNLVQGLFTSNFSNNNNICFTGTIGPDAYVNYRNQAITFTNCAYNNNTFTATYNFTYNSTNYTGTVTLNNNPSS